MKQLVRALAAGAIAGTLAIPAIAQEQERDAETMTCAEFLERDEEGRAQAIEALAGAIAQRGEPPAEGTPQEPEEQVSAERLNRTTSSCESEPDMPAIEAYQQAMQGTL